ncbi:MAG TPA: hypothetical protein QF556_05935 [Rhodospirillales bacterium]|nr:hypothetical protein [Rhodospirillales bacterium]
MLTAVDPVAKYTSEDRRLILPSPKYDSKKTDTMMAKKSLFSRSTSALGKDKPLTDEEIDRDVEKSVEAINQAKVETLEAESLLDLSWGEAGDMIYIMNLAPIYELIGGREGRMARGLQETCELMFSEHVAYGSGFAFFEEDHFVMRFTGLGPTDGFNKAAAIINDIGTRLLRDRFLTIDIPDLLVAADAGEVIGEDGWLDLEKVQAAVESGGLSLAMEKPGDDAPEWIKLRWRNTSSEAADWPAWDGTPEPQSADPEWGEITHQSRQSHRLTQRGPERRKEQVETANDQRKKNIRRAADNLDQMIW